MMIIMHRSTMTRTQSTDAEHQSTAAESRDVMYMHLESQRVFEQRQYVLRFLAKLRGVANSLRTNAYIFVY